MDLVPAMGGTRTVAAPDPIARDYLLLALRLDQHRPGLVDAYFGPADLKAAADMEALRPPARLAEDAAALRARVASEVDDLGRRAWFEAQITALEAQARVAAGEPISVEDLVASCFDQQMPRLDDAIFHAAAAEIEAILPGDGSLGERLEAWDRRLTIDPDRVRAVADHLAERFRRRAGALFGLPDGESVRLSMVHERPWSGYNWFEGGRRSRVEINLDLPITVPGLMRTVAHETYPGHHLEMATKEALLVDGAGRTELTTLLNNTPECLLHEGLADLGFQFAVPPDEEAGLLGDIATLAELHASRDQGAMAAIAATQGRLRHARATLRGISGNAALMRHADGRTREEVVSYLVDVGRRRPDEAAKQLEFIDDPIWRTYVFVYREGEELLRRWLDAAPEPDRATRFGRLLGEAWTPSTVRAEISPSSATP